MLFAENVFEDSLSTAAYREKRFEMITPVCKSNFKRDGVPNF